jgi:hypothetical protein
MREILWAIVFVNVTLWSVVALNHAARWGDGGIIERVPAFLLYWWAWGVTFPKAYRPHWWERTERQLLGYAIGLGTYFAIVALVRHAFGFRP